MLVKEVIQELQKYNPELEVMVQGYEYGLESITNTNIRESEAKLNDNLESNGKPPPWAGEHSECRFPYGTEHGIPIILFSRR